MNINEKKNKIKGVIKTIFYIVMTILLSFCIPMLVSISSEFFMISVFVLIIPIAAAEILFSNNKVVLYLLFCVLLPYSIGNTTSIILDYKKATAVYNEIKASPQDIKQFVLNNVSSEIDNVLEQYRIELSKNDLNSEFHKVSFLFYKKSVDKLNNSDKNYLDLNIESKYIIDAEWYLIKKEKNLNTELRICMNIKAEHDTNGFYGDISNTACDGSEGKSATDLVFNLNPDRLLSSNASKAIDLENSILKASSSATVKMDFDGNIEISFYPEDYNTSNHFEYLINQKIKDRLLELDTKYNLIKYEELSEIQKNIMFSKFEKEITNTALSNIKKFHNL